MYSDEDFLQLSALQHFVFCPRQCALIHIEQLWDENIFTAEGSIMHEKAHEERVEMRDGVRIERGVALRSGKLGFNGKADVVEFHKDARGNWLVFPVEYKHGRPKTNDCDKIQLCAQAICLEEMLNARVLKGAIFYGKTKRRLDVLFDEALRQKTKDTARRLHEFIKIGKTPLPEYSKRCESCSLVAICMPKMFEKRYSVSQYIKEAVQE